MSYSLTELQLDILRVLWDRGEATVTDVHEALSKVRNLAPTTVATLLGRLEKKGVVGHRSEGRQYVYAARVSEEAVRGSMVTEFTELADRLFAGDVAALVSQLFSARDVDADALARVRELIEARERELREEET